MRLDSINRTETHQESGLLPHARSRQALQMVAMNFAMRTFCGTVRPLSREVIERGVTGGPKQPHRSCSVVLPCLPTGGELSVRANGPSGQLSIIAPSSSFKARTRTRTCSRSAPQRLPIRCDILLRVLPLHGVVSPEVRHYERLDLVCEPPQTGRGPSPETKYSEPTWGHAVAR